MPKVKLADIFKNLDLIVCGASFVVLVAITFSGVIMRYFVVRPFVWLEEVQIWMMIWITLFGASAGFRMNTHVSIEVLVSMLPRFVQKLLSLVVYIVVFLSLAYLMYQGLALVNQFHEMNRTTSVLRIPSAIIYSSIPIGCVLMVVNYTVYSFRNFFSKEADKQ
ncbi:MAG: TRAP transporter small permease [Defluviitaleaceae bacterium]|nr:TRAP transporter small permease [Defluviitaleaceae bacterium]